MCNAVIVRVAATRVVDVMGVVSVAVGAAHYDSKQLAEHNPDVLFDDLSDVDAVLSVLG